MPNFSPALTRALFISLLVCWVEAASAAELRLEPRWRGEGPPPRTAAQLKVFRVPASGPWELVVERPLVLPRPIGVEIPPGKWAVTVDGTELWARYERFVMADAAFVLPLEVWPGGVVKGELAAASGESLPELLKVRFSMAPEVRGPSSGLESCAVAPTRVFRCRLPALKLDLRLRAGNLLSHYRWGLEVPQGREVDLGTLALRPGASVVGWVAVTGPATDLSKVRVALEPAGLASPLQSETTPRSQLMKRQAVANDRGFFYFDGVEPGAYEVAASLEPYGPAKTDVTVMEAGEAELREPLLLAPPEVLTAQVEPPQDPLGDPWRAVLARTDSRRNRGERVGEQPLGLDGFLRWEGLPRGRYLLSILGFDGKPWALAPVELGVDLMPLAIEVQPVRVKGLVTLANKPVAAQIWFGGRYGGVQAQFESDEQGHFEGMLPRPGEWKVEVESKAESVHVSLGQVIVAPRRGELTAETALELPNTKVKFLVVDEQSRPVRGRVHVSSDQRELIPDMVQKIVDETGRGELRGLLPGSYNFLARGAGGLESAVQSILLAEDFEPPTIELRLRPLRTLEVRVTSAGQPVPGARLMILPGDVPYAETADVRTEATGSAQAALPAASRQVQVMAYAPGLGFHMAVRAVPESGPLAVELSREMGVLRLKAPMPKDQTRSPATLRHLGAMLGWQALSAINSEVKKAGVLLDQALIPNAEPGAYSLCPGGLEMVPDAAHPNCVTGILAPNGELELVAEETP